MTEKQEKIVQAALRLFAENGYNATATSKVAKEAGVSEGLIFRHFGSKEGLLKAIMEMGREQTALMYEQILMIAEPKQKLRAILEIPFTIEQEQYHFWKLLYSIKWQSDIYDYSISAPLRVALVELFERLNYKNPEAEAEVVLLLIDGIAMMKLLRQTEEEQAVLRVIFSKYDLESSVQE